MKDKRLYPNTVIFQTTDGKGVTYYNARVLEQIRAEIEECLESINHIKAMPIQLYTPNEIEARKLTYEQCLGFIDKYK